MTEGAPPAIPPRGPRRILVGFDGSRPSDRAVRLALVWGEATGAAVFVVHASEPPHAIAEPRTDEARGAEASGIDLALADVRRSAEELGVPLTVWVREGAPARILIASTNEIDADLVVVGTRGLRGASRVLLGSVSSELLARAGRPVLVVP